MGNTQHAALLERLKTKQALVSILGLGYVGLPLATVFAEAGFKVIGIDPDAAKVAALQAGKSYVLDVGDEQIARLVKSGHQIGRASCRERV